MGVSTDPTSTYGDIQAYRAKCTEEVGTALMPGNQVLVVGTLKHEVNAETGKHIYEIAQGAKLTLLATVGICGTNLTWNLGFETGVLTISGTGAMEDYSSYTDVPWYDYRSSIKSIVINDGVTSIGSSAFSGCSNITSVTWNAKNCNSYNFGSQVTSFEFGNEVEVIPSSLCKGMEKLTSITIPNSVTSIGSSAFEGCSSLTSITIPNSVTSIGYEAFSGCSSLTSITIPNSVTSIGSSAFEGCSSLTSITIPNSVTSIRSGAFEGCSSLTSVTIPNSVTSIGEEAFYGCSSLTSVTIPNSVTSIGVAVFSNCTSLTSVTIPNSVKSIRGSAFYNCSSLTSITIPNNVTSIGDYTFYECSSLTSVTIPNSVTSIGSSAFEGCSSLTSITIPNSVKSIRGSAFYNCSSLTSVHTTDLAAWCNINFGNESANPLSSAHNLYLNGELVKDLVIPNSVTSIGSSAFDGCFSLTSVTIGNSVTSIGERAFYDCESLTSVTIPNSVTSIGYDAFNGCNKLVDVYCYATTPPVTENESTFSHYNAFLYVPCESKKAYMVDAVWGNFKYIECISSDNVTTDEIVITPSDNEANVIWPSVNGAASYELVIKDKDGNIVCTLIFNANGQLTSIAFNAPSRNGAPAQTQNAGFSFTITGLDSGTGYDLTLTAKDNSGNDIQTETISFITTGGNVSTDMNQVQSDEVQSTKVIKDGQVLILRNGKTYTMQGQEVK